MQRQFAIRRAFLSCCRRRVVEKDILEPTLIALNNESVKSSAAELAWIVIYCIEEKKITKTVIDRVGALYKALMDSPLSAPRVFQAKMIGILNEACNILYNNHVDMGQIFDFVATFTKRLEGYQGPAANSILWILSYVVIPPENNGHKRLITGLKKTSVVHAMVEAAIKTCKLDLYDANTTFMRSPSLKILFITEFRRVEIGGLLTASYSAEVRPFLGMDTPPPSQVLGSDVDDEELDLYIDSLLVESLLVDPPVSTPPKTKKARCVEPPHPTCTRLATPTPSTPSTPSTLSTIVSLSDMASKASDSTITSYFKIKRGLVTKVVKDVKPVNDYDFLLCMERPVIDW